MAEIRMYASSTQEASKLLPSPVDLSVGHEIIWSANTGRSTSPSDGALMMGDVVAQKMTFDISWGILTQTEFNKIKNLLVAGFKPFTLVLGEEVISISSYRGTLTAQLLGEYGGVIYYKSANVSVIQR